VHKGFRASECVFEYDMLYAFGDAPPPASLTFPVDAARHALETWPAFLYDLVPQGNGRRFLLGDLGRPDAQASDLPLLCAGAFNPIGRLRIREAVHYFDEHVERHGLAAGSFTFEELRARDAALPDHQAHRHYIVKRPRGPSEADRKVLRNEARYMEVAQRFGIRCFDLPALHGDMLFIPRFDRRAHDGQVSRFHQESAASIAGLAGFGIKPNQFHLLAAIRKVVDAPLDETIEFIKRDVLNLAMRNPDNHARNTAVHTVDGVTRITPLFDFAPMYLDPEGITRAARWYHLDSKKELQRWDDILMHLALPAAERRQVVEALVRFGEQMATLADCMREVGVDGDIVDFVVPSIEAQRTQLLALR
jgi:serine/threonine-protein kinase HipA